MTPGEHRRLELVVARGPMRAMAVAVGMVALGNAMMAGCVWSWIRIAGAPDATLWFVGAAAALILLGGLLGCVVYGWVRA